MAGGIEVAEAYVSILPSMARFQRTLNTGVSSAVTSAGTTATRQMESAGQRSGEGFTSKFAGHMKSGATKMFAPVAAAAATAGAVAATALHEALQAGSGKAKLTAQLGLDPAQAKLAGATAGRLYANGYGEGMEDITDAVKAVEQNIDGMRSTSEKNLEAVSGKALTLSSVFGTDVADSTRAVSQMMRTGLAKNAGDAFDIITKGMQNGADKSGDLLDTMNEYGTQFRKLGLDGKDATGLLSQGLQGGARDSDLVADSLKEFSIRSIDGSKTSAAAYKQLGLNAADMTARMAKGGKSASGGLDLVLQRLRDTKNPVTQASAAVGLFGTQAEDMGKALFSLHPETAAKGLGQVAGATDKANAAINSTPQAKLSNFVRMVKGDLTTALGNKLLPMLSTVGGYMTNTFGPVFKTVSDQVKTGTGPVGEWSRKAKDLYDKIGPLASAVGDFAGKQLQQFVKQMQTGDGPGGKFAKFIEKIGDAAQKAGQWLGGTLWPAIKSFVGEMKSGQGEGGKFSSFLSDLWSIISTVGGYIFATAIPAIKGIFQEMSNGNGTGGKIVTLFRDFRDAVYDVTKFLKDHPGAVKLAVASFAAFYTAKKTLDVTTSAVNNVRGKIDSIRGSAQRAGEKTNDLYRGLSNASSVNPSKYEKIGSAMRTAGGHAAGFGRAAGDAMRALVANPIGLIITGLVLLGLGLVEAYKHSETFRRIVNAAWDGIKRAAGAVVGWFQDTAWPLFKKVFDQIKDKADWLWKHGICPAFDGIKGAVKTLTGAFTTVKDDIGKAWDKLKDVVAKPIHFVVDTILNNGIIAGINGILPGDPVPKIKIKGFSGGGYTGSGGKYDPAGIVHAGEVVWSQADVAAVGGPRAADAMRPTRRHRGYSLGGIVSTGLGMAKATLTGHNPFDALFAPLMDKLRGGLGDLGDSPFAKIPEALFDDAKGAFKHLAGFANGGIVPGATSARPAAAITQIGRAHV